MNRNEIQCYVNGTHLDRTVDVRKTLADFLREDLGLTGTHLGCEHGVCGSCTVWLDGSPVRSCLILAVSCNGRAVTTIEGLKGPDATELRKAMAEHHGLQCGFCTPGFLMTMTHILMRKDNSDECEIREELAGNLCRCTGYQGIVDAALAVKDRASNNGYDK